MDQQINLQVISDPFIDEIMIVDLMPLAEAVGKKYAYKHHQYEPECIAEAYYQLTILVKNKHKLLIEAIKFSRDGTMGGYVRVSLFKALGRYFRFTKEKPNGQLAYAVFNTFVYDEKEMIDWLEHHFAEAVEVYKYLREGFDLDDLEYLKPKFKKLCKEVSKRRNTRINNLKRLERYGITPILQTDNQQQTQ